MLISPTLAEKVKALKARIAAAKKQLAEALEMPNAYAHADPEDSNSGSDSNSVVVDHDVVERDDDVEIIDADIGRSRS